MAKLTDYELPPWVLDWIADLYSVIFKLFLYFHQKQIGFASYMYLLNIPLGRLE